MQLTLCELNAENLFLSMEYYAGQDLAALSEADWRKCSLPQLRYWQKPLAKLWGLSEALHAIDPDIVMLAEVGGRDSLENFNRHFLGDRFVPYFIEGNSRRGIDLAFLVRRGLPLQAEALSNRDKPVRVYAYHGTYDSRFARDVAELRLSDDHGLKLILLLTHLKSKLSTEQDAQGKDLRTAEAIALSELYQTLRAEHPGVSLVVGGDFNAELSSLELELLNRTDLFDPHEPLSERFTYVYFDATGNPRPLVLDYLLASPDLRERVVDASIHRFAGRLVPARVEERYALPSDHYPVVLRIRI